MSRRLPICICVVALVCALASAGHAEPKAPATGRTVLAALKQGLQKVRKKASQALRLDEAVLDDELFFDNPGHTNLRGRERWSRFLAARLRSHEELRAGGGRP